MLRVKTQTHINYSFLHKLRQAFSAQRNEGADGRDTGGATNCHERNRWQVDPANRQHRPTR